MHKFILLSTIMHNIIFLSFIMHNIIKLSDVMLTDVGIEIFKIIIQYVMNELSFFLEFLLLDLNLIQVAIQTT